MWSAECVTIIAKDENEHSHTSSMAFRHMFIVTSGGYGQKGVRRRLPECVEKGVRALFPDAEHMGFKEE